MRGKSSIIIGLVAALVIVGGLAASPLYLEMLGSPDRRLDSQVAPDAELVRRAIAAIDQELGLLEHLFVKVDPQALEQQPAIKLAEKHADFWSDSPHRRVDDILKLLGGIEAEDRKRGTTIMGRGVANRLVPTGKIVVRDVQEVFKAQTPYWQNAEAALNRLRSLAVGDPSAATHLDVNRVRALFYLLKSRAECIRAGFEYEAAALDRRAAEESAAALRRLVADLQRRLSRRPTALIEAAQRRITMLDAGIAQLDREKAGLTHIISERENQVRGLQSDLAQLRVALERLDRSQDDFSDYMRRYQELSARARRLEAQVSAIQHGTLEGAEPVPQDNVDLRPPEYRNGTPTAGLEALRFQMTRLQERGKALQNLKSSVEKELEALRQGDESIKEEEDYLQEQVSEESKTLAGRLERSMAHARTATQAIESALKNLRDGSGAVKSAITAARKRANDAGQLARSGEKVDERLQRVSQDFETEAYLHTVAGEISFQSAVARHMRMRAVQRQKAIESEVAAMTGHTPPALGEAVAADEGESDSVAAANDVAEALKSFEQAGQLIGRISVRFPDNTSVSGKNLQWQAQVGQAACHLLLAALHAEDADKRFAEQQAAYTLLQGATEKHEQSHLLAPALDTILYLQQSVR